MADAGAVAAVPSGGPQAGTPAPAQSETSAQATQRIKLDLGDGEREYDLESVRGLARRGRSANQTLSLAEKRAQEAAKREDEAKEFRSQFESKDTKQVRAALKKMGVDVTALANDVGRELLEEMDLNPDQKKARDLERQLRERQEADEKGKQTERQKQEAAETERHTGELSDLFLKVMEIGQLPKESAAAVFPRIAQLYSAVEGSGGKVDPELAAERIRATITAEHRALYYKPDGKGGRALNIEAVKGMLGPAAFSEIRRHAVQEYRQKRAGGSQPLSAAPGNRQPTTPEPQRPAKPGGFWKDLDQKVKG